jgi:hypothetical protein
MGRGENEYVTSHHPTYQRSGWRNVAGALMKNFNLGPIGNSIAGLIGGGLGGQLLSMLTSGGASTAGTVATGSGMDVASILSSLAGGGVGGAVVMAIVGLIKAKMAKSS